MAHNNSAVALTLAMDVSWMLLCFQVIARMRILPTTGNDEDVPDKDVGMKSLAMLACQLMHLVLTST